MSSLRFVTLIVIVAAALGGCPYLGIQLPASENIAQEWMDLTLEALEHDDEMPTVESRTLFHISIAMYDSWAAYDPTAMGYLTANALDQPLLARSLPNRAEAISHAVYTVLSQRFARLGTRLPGTPGRRAFDAFTYKMQLHGYVDGLGNPVPSMAQELGEEIGQRILDHAANDGANESDHYEDTSGYFPVNPPLIVAQSGTSGVALPNEWQELVVDGEFMGYLTPHWGTLTPFAIPDYDPNVIRFDPGFFPQYGGESESAWIEEMVECLRYTAKMDPLFGAGTELINLSPNTRGNLVDGSHDGTGIPVNPYTNEPYADHWVPKGDFYRALSILPDGPRFTTPPPWWNSVALDVLRGNGYVTQRPTNKVRPSDLAYDVKLFFALNSALYDTALATWEVKRAYLGPRPITGLRLLAEFNKLPLEPGFIEEILPGDPLAGPNNEFAGGTKILTWAGDNQGVQWMRGEDWLPYQDMGFVTPHFPGYTSGHTAFGRTFAYVMSEFTGDTFFPGGLFAMPVDALIFEDDLSAPFTYQAATYHDLGTDAGLARIYAGVHIPSDVWNGQPIGDAVAAIAYAKAQTYFEGAAP